ncbi:MAG TPA: hypothetical protein VIV35_05420 [Chitinophagaceae bacterium]
MEEKNQQPAETLKDIKQIMERSSRFISLSGLSGIAAGICALAGAWIAGGMLYPGAGRTHLTDSFHTGIFDTLNLQLLGLAAATFTIAFIAAFYLTWRKAKKQNLPVWDHTSRRLLWNMLIPMVTGGLFILGMLYYNEWRFIGPSCLVFYGLSLVNASKYTLSDIRYLSYCEIILGLVNMLFIGSGLYFWAAGFGILHIVYGIIMWFKYERK